jgi:hypothetical protein
MSRRDLKKAELYQAVKSIVEEMDVSPHIHLPQHKLFTLFSIALQYMLFSSTKKPGAYILRVEDSQLLDKLARKSKDLSTRRFIGAIMLPRKISFQGSVFYLDFFHIGSWGITKDIPKEKLRGAVIIKNSSSKPMNATMQPEDEEDSESVTISLPSDYYLTSLTDVVPQTITIAYDQNFDHLHPVSFPFIAKESPEKALSGVKISKSLNLEDLEE